MKFIRSAGLARILIIRIINKPPQGGYGMEIYEFLKDVEEINSAREITLRYAASILEDFSNLTPKGRKVMADTLMELISGEIRLKNFQYQSFSN
jgi:hypothetical protein